MSFSEKVKLEAKRKAQFHCCWCQQAKVSIDVHHIIPESEGGHDTLDNAAPLCKDCHDAYGGNPSKRKEMRQRRDFWFEHCEKQSVILEKVEKAVQIIEDSTASGDVKFSRIESIVMELSDQNKQIMSRMDSFSPEKKLKAINDVAVTSSTIAAISGVVLNLGLEGRYEFNLTKTCPKCGKQFSVVPKPNVVPTCPKCGTLVTT